MKGTIDHLRSDYAQLKNHLSVKASIEFDAMVRLKEELESLRQAKQNLAMTINNLLAKKADKREVALFYIDDHAIGQLCMKAPGFSAAWQSCVTEAAENWADVQEGKFIFKRLLRQPTFGQLSDRVKKDLAQLAITEPISPD
jgi:hypothetical protein